MKRQPKRTNIGWVDFTINPWWGCTKISEGCKNCYAEELADGRFKRNNWGPNGIRQETKSWRKDLEAISRFAIETGKRQSVFIGSMMDIFESYHTMGGSESDNWQLVTTIRDEVLEQALFMPELDFIFLTKRSPIACYYLADGDPDFTPPSNIWIATSVCNQDDAVRHWQNMKAIHEMGWQVAVSSEPRLGPICWDGWEFISCLITGGESGSNARPMHPDYPRADRDWCAKHGIPYFFKQWGRWKPNSQEPGPFLPTTEPKPNWDGPEFVGDNDYLMRHVPSGEFFIAMDKELTGHLLDGQSFRAVPWALTCKTCGGFGTVFYGEDEGICPGCRKEQAS